VTQIVNVRDVRAGKVRYLSVSDTPAWKIVEANVTARFRGWSAFIGLQIEYSLLERTVEQELVPMALEFGFGITPCRRSRAARSAASTRGRTRAR
jgi:aryl-alcohol dehydrogenase-like predicted oxidoreductase